MTAEAIGLALPWPGGLEDVSECPVCGDPRRREERADLHDESFAAAPGTWRLQRCLGCQALYLGPRPDRATLHLAYRNYYTHATPPQTAAGFLARTRRALSNGYRNRVFATNLQPSLGAGAVVMPLFASRAAHIRREDRGLGRAATNGGRVLDVGCGNGGFLAWARELGWQCYGVEIDAAAAAVVRDLGIAVLGSELRELGAEHLASFDAVTLSHVIEHVYDPVETLRQCWRLLKPGGYLWIETPNTDSSGYEIYGSHWRGLEAPRHLVLFNIGSLRWILERAGFERIQCLPPTDVTASVFTLSASMQSGRIAEKDARSLPPDIRARTRAAVRRARGIASRDPAKAEFVTAVAYRPPARSD